MYFLISTVKVEMGMGAHEIEGSEGEKKEQPTFENRKVK